MPETNQKFKGKVVVVTGASAGIGYAISLAFAKQGADVAMLSRNKERLAKLKDELQIFSIRSFIMALDVSDPNEIEKAANLIEQELGAIDIWVNNAMVSVFSPVKEMKAEEYKRVTEV